MSPDDRRDEPGNVGVAAARHDLPRRLRGQREQPVVVEEADERERGKRTDRVERGRPDGRGHRKQIPVGKRFTEPPRLEKVAERLAFGVRRPEQRGRLAIEAHDLSKQGEVRGPHQVPPLREEPVDAAAAVFEPAPPARHRERHVRVARGDAELAEQPHQVRIGAVVVHQEAGIERARRRSARSTSTVLVWPPSLGSFSNRCDAVAAAQQVRGRQPRDPGADDRDGLSRRRPSCVSPRNTNWRGVVKSLSMTNS